MIKDLKGEKPCDCGKTFYGMKAGRCMRCGGYLTSIGWSKKVTKEKNKKVEEFLNEKFIVSENTIMWAFRYALGRRTGAVTDVCNTLKENWKKLSEFTKIQIKREISRAIEMDIAGDTCDIDAWEEFLDL